MEDFLTARQVQELLKVDRITIYRMINDGRLKGSKIGQQWRFPRGDVESLLTGAQKTSELMQLADDSSLPVHCLQTIQDLFSAVSEFPAVLVNLQGKPITSISQPCEFCRLICSTPAGSEMCQESWQKFFQLAKQGESRFTCQFGLDYAGQSVTVGSEIIGLFLVGGFRREDTKLEIDDGIFTKVIEQSRTSHEVFSNALESVPLLSNDLEEKLDTWAAATAQAFESILHERSAFALRLKRIADLTQIP